MKKLITGLTLATILAVPAMTLASPDRMRDPGKRMDHMQRELDLTDEQRSKIEAIFQEHHQKMMELRDSTEEQVNKVLTDEQQKEFEGMREERHERFRDKMNKYRDDDNYEHRYRDDD